MRLFMSSGSPFVRKCRVVIREKGLVERVQEQIVDFPYKAGDDFLAANPIGQVPALTAEDGQPMTNSAVICAYLDGLSGEPRLLPAEGADHWRVLRTETLADGMLEMIVKLVLENRRPENERSPTWIGYWRQGLGLALDALEALDLQAARLDLGVITAGIAVTYLDFRFPEERWRDTHPKLAKLQAMLEARPSFVETYPK
jgi:glutathione S-transferase